jgi:hypothetical protein
MCQTKSKKEYPASGKPNIRDSTESDKSNLKNTIHLKESPASVKPSL